MARMNRRDVLSDQEVQVVHCINRCVRRAFLCGVDPVTGADYDHRRELVRQRMEFLAGVMGVDVLGFAVMSNHFHVIVRNRPDVVGEWSDAQIVEKWWQLCPARKNADGTAKEPTEQELTAMAADKVKLKEWRARLSSVSWFMRFLCEKVAREANKQDKCTGRFWEGRFKAQLLLDEAALLACMQYVDLNPVRAGIAESPETSEFTSAKERIDDLKSADEVSTPDARDNRIEHGQAAGWMSPVPLDPPRKKVREKPIGSRPSRASEGSRQAVRRCSNKGCLPMGLGDYLELLDWTGRQLRLGKRGSIPSNLAPILERLQINSDVWLDCIEQFHKWFRGSAGLPSSMQQAAESRHQNRAIGIQSSKQLLA